MTVLSGAGTSRVSWRRRARRAATGVAWAAGNVALGVGSVVPVSAAVVVSDYLPHWGAVLTTMDPFEASIAIGIGVVTGGAVLTGFVWTNWVASRSLARSGRGRVARTGAWLAALTLLVTPCAVVLLGHPG